MRAVLVLGVAQVNSSQAKAVAVSVAGPAAPAVDAWMSTQVLREPPQQAKPEPYQFRLGQGA